MGGYRIALPDGKLDANDVPKRFDKLEPFAATHSLTAPVAWRRSGNREDDSRDIP